MKCEYLNFFISRRRSDLIIKNLSAADSGKYECRAKNKLTKKPVSKFTTLIVRHSSSTTNRTGELLWFLRDILFNLRVWNWYIWITSLNISHISIQINQAHKNDKNNKSKCLINIIFLNYFSAKWRRSERMSGRFFRRLLLERWHMSNNWNIKWVFMQVSDHPIHL